MRNLKIYVADDHTLYRKAIAKLLAGFSRVREVKEAANGKELLNLVRRDIPDVAIIDLEMPILNGTKTCEKLNLEFPEVKIIIVSMHDSQMEIYQLLQNGAHAFLSKNSDVEEFECAIYTTVDKGIYRNKIMSEALSSYIGARKKPIVNLTRREKDILKHICKGLTNKLIGEKLSLSEFTVRNHRVSIMRKVGVKNTVTLVNFATNNALLKD
jgi:DNA-binding NarL/FixJ family response regulator